MAGDVGESLCPLNGTVFHDQRAIAAHLVVRDDRWMTRLVAARAALRGLVLGDAFGETWFSKKGAFLDRALTERWVPGGPWC